jgi:hypothetical protein
VLGASVPGEGECTVETAGDELVAPRARARRRRRFEVGSPRPPERQARSASPRPARCNRAPRSRRPRPLCSIGSWAGEGLAGDSAGSAGSSRGTGSSSGSTVKVRSGSLISTSPPDPSVALIRVWRLSRVAQTDRGAGAVRAPPTAQLHRRGLLGGPDPRIRTRSLRHDQFPFSPKALAFGQFRLLIRFARARGYQIHGGDVKDRQPELVRAEGIPGLLPFRRQIEFVTSRTPREPQTMTEFLNPTP